MKADSVRRIASIACAVVISLAACGDSGAQSETAADGDSDVAVATSAATDAAVEPDRYFGMYGDAADPGEVFGMVFVVAARPPPMADRFPDLPSDYIMITAAWADVAPYYMKPLSATRFEQDFVSDFQPEALVAEFELDDTGQATSVTFATVLAEFGPRARLGDVPEEYR